jgi:hypothetical protein
MQDDVEAILQIKTSSRNDNDFLAWHLEKRGLFKVKSAYRLALHTNPQFQDRGATSERPDGARPSWKVIWNCQVPPKVKLLVWKICRSALSRQSNLARRKMLVSNLCPLCGTEAEDTFHIFMRCPHARHLWQKFGHSLMIIS